MISLAERLDRWCGLQDLAAVWQERIPLAVGAASLLPVCHAHLADDALMDMLAKWRNEHVVAFPSRFVATADSTRRWLANNVLAGDRALFLIVPEAADGRAAAERYAFGHVGICGYRHAGTTGRVELENIVRGVAGAAPGAMAAAMAALIELCEQCDVRGQDLRVFDDNAHAIRFYERLGFVAGERAAMVACGTGDDGSVRTRDTGDSTPATEHLLSMHRNATEQFEVEESGS